MMQPGNEPLAERRLTWDDGAAHRDVHVRVWKPVAFEHHYVCDFAVDGLPEPARAHGSGVDGLDALVNALAGVRAVLAPYRERISWLDIRGWHGIPMSVRSLINPAEDYRLEQLVESEVERSLEERAAPGKQRVERYRSQYDPNFHDDLTNCATDELIKRLSAAAIAERDHRANGDDAAAGAFTLQRLDLMTLLRKRPEFPEVLQALATSDDRALRLQATQELPWGQLKIATLERLRDDRIDPESSEAQQILLMHQKAEARPKPWDTT